MLFAAGFVWPPHDAVADAAKRQREREYVRLDHRGQFALANGMPEQALQTWQKAHTLKPGSVDMINKVGMAQTRLGKHAEAEQSFRRAIALDDDEPQSYFNLALLYLRRKEYPKADLWLRRTLGRADWYPETHYHLGYIRETHGRYQEAADEYLAELNVNPASANGWHGLLSLKKRGLIPSTYRISRRKAADWSASSVAALTVAVLAALATWRVAETWSRTRNEEGTHKHVES